MNWIVIAFIFKLFFLQESACHMTTCTPSVVERGEPALISCQFSADVIQAKMPVVVFKVDVNDPAAGKSILDCVWTAPDNHTCYVDPRFTCNCRHLENLTLAIPTASEQYTGKYECKSIASDGEDIVSCQIKLSEDNTHTSEQADGGVKDNALRIILGIVVLAVLIGLVAALLLFHFRKGIKVKFCQHILRRNNRPQPLRDSASKLIDIRPLRVVVIGKTGSGKSTLCNVMLSEKAFEIGNGLVTMTKHIQSRENDNLEVTDTPDIWNLETDREGQTNKMKKALANAHVIVLAVRKDAVYTNNDLQIYEHLKRESGYPAAFCERLVVVFTFGDRVRTSIGEMAGTESEQLKKVLADASGRNVVFYNSHDSSISKQTESLSRLTDIINQIIGQGTPLEVDGQIQRKKDNAAETGQAVLLLGKSGSGKSWLGNKLLGFKAFRCSTTAQAAGAGGFNPLSSANDLKVVDTPDISNLTDERKLEEVRKWKELTSPGPLAFLLMIRCDVEYTVEEYAIYQQVKNLWGDPDFISERLILIFNFADRQDLDTTEYVKQNKSDELKNVFAEANERSTVFSKDTRRKEMAQSVKTLKEMIQNLKTRSHAMSEIPLASSVDTTEF